MEIKSEFQDIEDIIMGLSQRGMPILREHHMRFVYRLGQQ